MSRQGFGSAWDAGEGLPREPDPRLDVKSVPCPSCDAQPNEPCLNLGLRTSPEDRGKPCGVHPSRKRMAIRARNRELGL